MGIPELAPHVRHTVNDPTHGARIELGIPDLVGPDLRILFCGINPGQRSGELGLHFARPGNRFWKLLHAGGFTDHVFAPSEQAALPALGLGITNLVERVTVSASELAGAELRAGDSAWRRKPRTSDLTSWPYSVSGPIAPLSAAHERRWANRRNGSPGPDCGSCPTRADSRLPTRCPR